MPEPKDRRIIFKASKTMLQAVDRIAEEKDIKRSQVVRDAIMEYLKTQKEG